MNYNIHPIFVHFPIALLFLYSIIKILPLQKWLPRIAWRDIERVLLAIGVLGAFAGLATGENAEHLIRPNHQLVNMHATFASAATWIYGALLAGEIFAILNAKNILFSQNLQFIPKLLHFFERVLCHPVFSVVLAVVGLFAISITGLLGGAIIYGTSADPVAHIVLKILGISL